MMDINQILEGLRSTIQYPALILENLSSRYIASNPDNSLEVINGGFQIIDHLRNPDDFGGEVILIERMKDIGHQIIVQMLQDYLKYEPLAERAIPRFDVNTVSFGLLGPVFDNDYGVHISLNVVKML